MFLAIAIYRLSIWGSKLVYEIVTFSHIASESPTTFNVGLSSENRIMLAILFKERLVIYKAKDIIHIN